MLDNFTIIFRSSSDTHFYVVGDSREVRPTRSTRKEHIVKSTYSRLPGVKRHRSPVSGPFKVCLVPDALGRLMITWQNELILAAVLDCFFDSLSTLLR
jgi:hypothetical protein